MGSLPGRIGVGLAAALVFIGAGVAIALLPTSRTVLALTIIVVLGFLLRAATLPADRFASTTVIAIMAIAVLMPVLRVTHAGFTGRLAYGATLVVIAIGGVGVARAVLARPQARMLPIWSLIGLVAVTIVSTGLHDNPRGWQRLGLSSALALAVALIARSAGADERDRIYKAIVGLAIFESLLAFFGLITNSAPLWVGARVFPSGVSLPLQGGLFQHARQQGTLGHPLPLSFLVVVAWAVIITRPKLFPPLWLRICLSAVIVAGVLTTATTSGILLLPIILFLFSGPASDRLWRTSVVVVGLALVVVSLAFSSSFYSDSATQSGSYTHRVGALNSGKRLASSQPTLETLIGNGAASEPRLYRAGLLQNDGLQAVDNQYVDIMVQAGLIGLLFLVLALVASFSATDTTVAAFLLVVVAEAAVFDTLVWPATAVLIGLAVGFACTQRSPVSAPVEASPGGVTRARAEGPTGRIGSVPT